MHANELQMSKRDHWTTTMLELVLPKGTLIFKDLDVERGDATVASSYSTENRSSLPPKLELFAPVLDCGPTGSGSATVVQGSGGYIIVDWQEFGTGIFGGSPNSFEWQVVSWDIILGTAFKLLFNLNSELIRFRVPQAPSSSSMEALGGSRKSCPILEGKRCPWSYPVRWSLTSHLSIPLPNQ